jgi:DNA-directed RNA polymerase alpha subunit
MMFDLGSDLPDDTLVEMVRLPTRIRNAAKFAGLKTIGDLRQTTDKTFASIPNLGLGSVKWLRAQLSERLSPAIASSSATTAKGK